MNEDVNLAIPKFINFTRIHLLHPAPGQKNTAGVSLYFQVEPQTAEKNYGNMLTLLTWSTK